MSTYFHYTNSKGCAGIISSGEMYPSLRANNPKDARFGDGQYFTDILPHTKTSAQLARIFLGVPWGAARFSHFLQLDLTGLNVQLGRQHVYVVQNSGNLSVSGRVLDHGVN